MKLTTTTMISVDGVMQGLGTPDEDRRGDFARGGWVLPLFDEDAAAELGKIYARADAFLFGRWTYEVFAASWGAMAEIPPDNPVAVALNTRARYVVSTTLKDAKWAKEVISADIETAIRKLKAEPGGELQVHGSGQLVRWLLERNLIDEINLITFSLILGQGKRLFPEIGSDRALELVRSRVSNGGAIFSVFRPAGRPRYEAATSQSTTVKS